MRKGWYIGVVILVLVGGPLLAVHSGGGEWLMQWLLALHGKHGSLHASVSKGTPPEADVAIPFELVTGHLMFRTTVNDSAPLSFILDSGDKFGIIDSERAKALGLTTSGSVTIKGIGPSDVMGTLVSGADYRVTGLTGFSQSLALAMPLQRLARQLGHDVDGIFGADFISKFVVEVDYQARTMTLHNKDTFAYHGAGESIPTRLNSSGHPIVDGAVTPVGGAPIPGSFTVDLGAADSLALFSPFVAAHHLPGTSMPTVPSLGTGGTGGSAIGRVGRVAALTIGSITVPNPITLFSEDTAGAFASADNQGNIGHQILGRFRIFLDYGHGRIILEPDTTLARADDLASSGLRVEAEGQDYRTFRIKEVRPGGPGADAGLRADDVIMAIDGKAASELTLTNVVEMFERVASYRLTIGRGDKALTVTLAPARVQ